MEKGIKMDAKTKNLILDNKLLIIEGIILLTCLMGESNCLMQGIENLGAALQVFDEKLGKSVGCHWTFYTTIGNLQYLLLLNDTISGLITTAIGKLEKFHNLDLFNSILSGEIPSSLGALKNLNYLRLTKNSLTGPCLESLSNIEGLNLVDLSFNNLSAPCQKHQQEDSKLLVTL